MKTYTLAEYPGLAEFLRVQDAATLAVPVDASGTLHAATLLFAHSVQPLAFYFVTGRDTEKCALLHVQADIPAAVVVGTVRELPFTLQMRGRLSQAPLPPAVEVAYYQKRGNRHDDINDPKNISLVFRPTWARFTDYAKDYAQFLLDVT